MLFTMLMQIFCFRNLYQRMQSKWGALILQCGRDVCYDFMNWAGLCIKLATSFTKRLNLPACRETFFILDDTVMPQPSDKRVKLCACIFDYIFQRWIKGYTNMKMAWTDGSSTIHIGLNLMCILYSRRSRLCCAAVARNALPY